TSKLVSIRPPPCGGGNLAVMGGSPGWRCVSIRPPPCGGGNRLRPARHFPGSKVSIRPPPCGGGNPSPQDKSKSFGRASIRPPPCGGGNPLDPAIIVSCILSFNPPPALRRGESASSQTRKQHGIPRQVPRPARKSKESFAVDSWLDAIKPFALVH